MADRTPRDQAPPSGYRGSLGRPPAPRRTDPLEADREDRHHGRPQEHHERELERMERLAEQGSGGWWRQ